MLLPHRSLLGNPVALFPQIIACHPSPIITRKLVIKSFPPLPPAATQVASSSHGEAPHRESTGCAGHERSRERDVGGSVVTVGRGWCQAAGGERRVGGKVGPNLRSGQPGNCLY